MITTSSKLIIANWKMNVSKEQSFSLLSACYDVYHAKEFVVCPPFIYTESLKVNFPKIAFGGQDCSSHKSGAYTGEVSASMLSEVGCDYVILGHYERRSNHKETNDLIRQKVARCLECNLIPIVCVGEPIEVMYEGGTVDYILDQLSGSIENSSKIIIAYEPIWAIGSNLVPNLEQLQHVFDRLSEYYQENKLIYGGSVNLENFKDLLKLRNIDGLLLGKASLESNTLITILTE
jgi:triosephosphate isomerase